MHRLLLIQTGEAPEPLCSQFGGFAKWFRAATRLDDVELRVVRVDHNEPLPAATEVAGAIITGSTAMVTDHADWSERTADWIRSAVPAGTPVYGVCYGHQLMAHALGGKVGWLPAGREIGTQQVTRRKAVDGAEIHLLPTAFLAHTTHRQSVLEPPPGAEVLARSARDPCQLVRYAPNVLSSQFHPEFTAPIMRAYIAARADVLRSEGQDPDALTAAVRETESARALLEGFARAALARHPVNA